MNGICESNGIENKNLIPAAGAGAFPSQKVDVPQRDARAIIITPTTTTTKSPPPLLSAPPEQSLLPNLHDVQRNHQNLNSPIAKKRKTRRGKSKRNKAPYYNNHKYGRKNHNNSKKPQIIKPDAPHNDNQFLFEDHGGFEELDERLKNIDQHQNQQASTSSSSSTLLMNTRTRNSSFSVDSDGVGVGVDADGDGDDDDDEFYSSPDDEDEYLMQDFNDQYQSIQTEQLHTMSKHELIQEYLALDNRSSQRNRDLEETIKKLEKELECRNFEKETLQKENDSLKTKLEHIQKNGDGGGGDGTNNNNNSDSADSETDSSDSCCSSASASISTNSDSNNSVNISRAQTPSIILNNIAENNLDYAHTNGHISPSASVMDAV